MASELKQGAFVIRKIHSAYLVSVIDSIAFVAPLPGAAPIAASGIISSTMQMVGNSKLLLNQPADPCEYLMSYYKDLGWRIEIAD